MSKQKHNLNESDDSDEDFCPESELKNSSNLEDGSSNNEESDDCDDDDDNDNLLDNKKNKKNIEHINTKRSTRRNPEEKKNLEKDIIESDEEDEKKRSDKLWESFLSDTNSEPNTKKKENGTEPVPTINIEKAGPLKRNDSKETGEKVKITEILDFAGEEIKITKEVNQSDLKKSKTNSKIPIALPSMLKRPAGGGLSSVLEQIGKKTKISVLQKTKLDWESFKSKEGLKEDLKTFNKGRDGYLEKQDFLERTDLRQFEIEKNLRQTKRSNN